PRRAGRRTGHRLGQGDRGRRRARSGGASDHALGRRADALPSHAGGRGDVAAGPAVGRRRRPVADGVAADAPAGGQRHERPGLRLLEARLPELMTRLAGALGAADPVPELAAARVAHLAAQAHVTRLGALGVEAEAVPEVVAAARERPELANTPEPPDADELHQ